jgi:threonine dehydratase
MATPAASRIELPVALADVEAAARRIDGAVMRTPTLLSSTLSERTGATVYVKLENMQFTAPIRSAGTHECPALL